MADFHARPFQSGIIGKPQIQTGPNDGGVVAHKAILTIMRDFAARYTAAWCSQDPARVAAFFSADGSLRVNDGPPAVGRNAIAGVAQSFMKDFPDLVVIMDGVETQGDRVIYLWTLTGTKDGRHVRISGFEQWRMAADGLIAESQGHFDSDDYQRQLTA